ncbi:hypothetical protein [Nitrosopumilus sp. Nsub]|uniref:hypothetical protein n=1 Tax=Nitrosopumilus sp. Nsub TaxID=1776294 RepID=UPI000835823B|nr:hypothetical protein [Nitrosopumilus sp. Nsub]
MASVVIAETILIIASVVIASSLAGVMLTKTNTFQSAFIASSDKQKEIILTDIAIVYASNPTSNQIDIWVKNIGIQPVTSPDSIDVYFGKMGSMQKIPYDDNSAPKWVFYSTTSVWNVDDTIQLTLSSDYSLSSDTIYNIRIVTPNGVSSDYIFTAS